MSDTLARLFDRIDRLEERERFADALVVARRACALAPGEPAAWEARGEMALRSGELAESAESWDRLTRLEPGSAGTWFGLGEALQWNGRGDSDACFQRAARLDPDGHVVPHRISLDEFEAIAGAVLPALPVQVIDFLEDTGTGIAALRLPAMAMVVESHLDPHALGYWLGNVYGVAGAWGLDNPAAIEIYQLNIENWCPDRATLTREIRRTVLHEVGHAVGMDHATLHVDGY
jgi:predicted Zn-dependent protease with MMP-like domain